ncbi:hypothetical protein CVT24_000059, partial [Panaeolus cyanescens]
MPIDSASSLTTAVFSYAPEPIFAAVAEIMTTVSPFIGSSFDSEINQSLKEFRERFIRAVQHTCVAIKHTLAGLSLLCSLLEDADTKPNPLSTVSQLREIAEDLLAGNACAADAHEQYKALRSDAEGQLSLLSQKFGEETVINVSGKSNTTKSTFKFLRHTITMYIHESEKVLSATVDILTGVNNLLRTFLEDETFSLANLLTTAPLFALDMFSTWKELRTRFISFQAELRRPMLKFEMGYILDADESSRELEEDKEARKPQIPEVVIKWQGIPQDSGTADPQLSPSREKIISVGIRKTSGKCTVYLERLENLQHGTTGLRAIISIPVFPMGSGLKGVCIYATLKSETSDLPACTLNNRTTTVEQIVQDPNFEPTNCRPIFSTRQPSRSTLRWKFSHPLLRWLRWKLAPTLPTQLALSFDIEHSIDVNLHEASLTAAALSYSPHPVPGAIREVMEALSPLVSSDSFLDADINQSLKDIVERFRQAAHYMCIGVRHAVRSLTMICSVLADSDTKPDPSSTANQLRRAAEDCLAGWGGARDAFEHYQTLRKDVNSQFDLLAEKFGEESVISISGKSNITNRSLKTLRTTVNFHLQESEKASSATVDILQGVANLLRAFLEDESFSLSNPVTAAPLFALDMFRTWKTLREHFSCFHIELRRSMMRFNMGYIMESKEARDVMNEDKRTRLAQIPEIHVKLQGIPLSPSASKVSLLPPR